MIVEVLLFAQARQIAERETIEVELRSSEPKVAELKQAIEVKYPQLAALLSRSNIAIDQQYMTDSDTVAEGVEVAMIPPVSGG